MSNFEPLDVRSFPLGKLCVRALEVRKCHFLFKSESDTCRTFYVYLMKMFEYVRISNAWWSSCSEILKNRCLYSLDTRKIWVRHNTTTYQLKEFKFLCDFVVVFAFSFLDSAFIFKFSSNANFIAFDHNLLILSWLYFPLLYLIWNTNSQKKKESKNFGVLNKPNFVCFLNLLFSLIRIFR